MCSCRNHIRCKECILICGIPMFCKNINPCSCHPIFHPHNPPKTTSPVVIICSCDCSTHDPCMKKHKTNCHRW